MTNDYKTGTAKLTSPDGFEMNIYNNPLGIGGACNPDSEDDNESCPYVETYSTQPVSLPGVNPDTYLIKYYLQTFPHRRDLFNKTIGLYTLRKDEFESDSFVTVKETHSFPPYLIFSKKGQSVDDGDRVWARGEYSETFAQSKLTPDKYYALPDLKTAELILKSMKFE